jgi:hypothetical protein
MSTFRIEIHEIATPLFHPSPTLVEHPRCEPGHGLVSRLRIACVEPRARIDPSDKFDAELPPFPGAKPIFDGGVGRSSSDFELLLDMKQLNLIGMARDLVGKRSRQKHVEVPAFSERGRVPLQIGLDSFEARIVAEKDAEERKRRSEPTDRDPHLMKCVGVAAMEYDVLVHLGQGDLR